MHICKYEAIHESYFMIVEMRKSTPRNTYTQNSKIKSTSNKLKEEICFILKIYYSSQSKRRLIIKYFLTNNSKTKKEGRGWPFLGGCSFYMKNEVTSEIFNGKKNYKQKCFSLSWLRIWTGKFQLRN